MPACLLLRCHSTAQHSAQHSCGGVIGVAVSCVIGARTRARRAAAAAARPGRTRRRRRRGGARARRRRRRGPRIHASYTILVRPRHARPRRRRRRRAAARAPRAIVSWQLAAGYACIAANGSDAGGGSDRFGSEPLAA
jgi:hypothetical protein